MTSETVGRKRKFTTSIPSESSKLVWKIKDLLAITRIDQQLSGLKLDFYAGDKIGLPSKWRFCLKLSETGAVGIYLQLLKPPEGGKPIFAEFAFACKEEQLKGFDYRMSNTKSMLNLHIFFPQQDAAEPGNFIHNYRDCSWGFVSIFPSVNDFLRSDVYMLEDGYWTIHFRFTLYNEKEVTSEKAPKIAKIPHSNFCSELRKDFKKLLDSGVDADVKIRASDGKLLKAHKLVLATRSPVFFAMFKTKMTESASGVVSVPDLSSKVMRIVLKFIYTGKVDEKSDGIIEEVIYAADKYSLLSLKKYCDRQLGSLCTPENAYKLMKVAKLHRLTHAEKKISEYIKTNIGDILIADNLL